MAHDWRVISRARMPSNVPLALTIAVGLLLDRLHASGWIWGAVGALFAAIWVACIIGIAKQEPVDVLGSGPK